MSYGFRPWLQTSWDARAAANFIGGGIGSGLLVFAALSGASGLALTCSMVWGIGTTLALGAACYVLLLACTAALVRARAS